MNVQLLTTNELPDSPSAVGPQARRCLSEELPQTFIRAGGSTTGWEFFVMSKEVWRDVPGYEGRYLVGNRGRVYSLLSDKILTPKDDGDGYPQVALYKDGVRKDRRIHQLVAAAFLGPSNGLVVNHKNGIKTDNRVSNLEYTTQSQNSSHAWKTGLIPAHVNQGTANPHAKLDEMKVKEIRYLLENTNMYQHEIAKHYGVSQNIISKINRGLLWSHV